MKNKQSNKLKDCFLLKENWICSRCFKQNSSTKNSIKCQECDMFRPLKSYYYLFRNMNGEVLVDERRSYEKQTILGIRENLRKQASELNQDLKVGYQNVDDLSPKYIISNRWYAHWLIFVNNISEYSKESEWIFDSEFKNMDQKYIKMMIATQKSNIKGVGILDPGPIDNSDLFTSKSFIKCESIEAIENNNYNTNDLKNDCTILPFSTSSYTVISELEWKFLWTHYGGGPIIKRRDCDISSEPLDSTEEIVRFDEKIALIKSIPSRTERRLKRYMEKTQKIQTLIQNLKE